MDWMSEYVLEPSGEKDEDMKDAENGEKIM